MKESEQSDPQTYALIGAAMEVHRELGHGFLERVYQEALAVELATRKIPFARELDIPVKYKEESLNCGYRADFVGYGEIIIELKAVASLDKSHESQVINYLNATGYGRGLLFNFGSDWLEYRRFVN